MKNRNFILCVLFWLVASVCMAITLPRSSYNADLTGAMSDNESYVLSVGTQFMNHAVLTAYNSECDQYRPTDDSELDGNIPECNACCVRNFERGEARNECILNCSIPLGMPLGTTLCLAPFALAYAGFMFYRRRKENAEQA